MIKDKFKIVVGPHEKAETDVFINFLFVGITTGPDTAVRVIKEAGDQVYYTLVLYKNNIKPSDCFLTIPGFLKADVIVHSIISPTGEGYNQSFFNIKSVLINYAEKKLCRKIVLNIDDKAHWKLKLFYAFRYLRNLNFIDEIVFYTDEEKMLPEYNKYLKTLIAKEEPNVFQRLKLNTYISKFKNIFSKKGASNN